VSVAGPAFANPNAVVLRKLRKQTLRSKHLSNNQSNNHQKSLFSTKNS